jgi:hypothetical protein
VFDRSLSSRNKLTCFSARAALYRHPIRFRIGFIAIAALVAGSVLVWELNEPAPVCSNMEGSLYLHGYLGYRVDRITADAVNDEKRGAIFPVTLALKTKQIDVDGKMIQLVPGMNLTAEIKTGKRRVIEYLLSPIQRVGSDDLRER